MAGNRQHLVERARRPAGWTRVLIVSLAAWTSAGDAMAQQRPPLPDAVLAQMNRLDVQCKSAGGRPGNARYVIAQDFTGDGVLDYLLSEGNYACSGRPNLFRRDGEARVEVFVADRTGRAHRAYSEVLTAYRVLAGQPVRLQIARKGAACGQGTPPNRPCGGELAWNGRTFGLAGSANQTAVSPGTRAEGATSPAPSTRGETEAGSSRAAAVTSYGEIRAQFAGPTTNAGETGRRSSPAGPRQWPCWRSCRYRLAKILRWAPSSSGRAVSAGKGARRRACWPRAASAHLRSRSKESRSR